MAGKYTKMMDLKELSPDSLHHAETVKSNCIFADKEQADTSFSNIN
ncbi:hypothetical protein [Oceanobacillus jeddahense]|nr:hypothetical protein [Oceanobacillus jeddahense]